MSQSIHLPPGWRDTLFQNADLDATYRELDGCDHFFADVVRGRIRSFQFRFQEAWEHFDRADERSDDAEENLANLIQKFLLEIYRFENALVEAPVTMELDIGMNRTPLMPPQSFVDYPEVKYVVDLRTYCEARLLLHLGSCEEAARLFSELIHYNPDASPARLAGYYLDFAACQQGLGDIDRAENNLQNAELAVAAIDGAFDAARLAASLFAFYRFLDDEQKSGEWKAFLLHLPCPKTTKRLFVLRAQRLLERCFDHCRLVSF